MPLAFEAAGSKDAHYVFATMNKVQMMGVQGDHPRITFFFVEGEATVLEVMEYARKVAHEGSSPPMREAFAEPEAVNVVSYGVTIGRGYDSGLPPIIDWAWRNFGCNFLEDAVVHTTQQYDFHIPYYAIGVYMEHLYGGEGPCGIVQGRQLRDGA